MILRSIFPDPLNLENISYATTCKIREVQRDNFEKTIKELTIKLIKKSETRFTLAQVRDALISKGVNAENCQYVKSDFAERLDINLAEADFNLNIPLFPKQDPKRGITLNIAKARLHKDLNYDSTPESVAELILAISEWLPEYYAIEIRIQEEEMRKQTIRELAADLLKRNIGAILKEKGYEYTVLSSPITDKASLIIKFSKAFKMTLEVDLMEEFLDQVRKVAESLPANKVMDSFNNVQSCYNEN